MYTDRGGSFVRHIAERNVTTEADVQKHYPLEDVQHSKKRNWQKFTRRLKPVEDPYVSSVQESDSSPKPLTSSRKLKSRMSRRLCNNLAKFLIFLIAPLRFIWCIFVLIGNMTLYGWRSLCAVMKNRRLNEMILNRMPVIKFVQTYHKAIWSQSRSLSEDSSSEFEDKKSLHMGINRGGINIGVHTPEQAGRSIALDFAAGLVETVMALPQAMSYSLLANMPIVQGLIGQAVFPGVFSTFTTAYTVCAGVSAIENLMAGDSITRLLGKVGDPVERVNAGSALALAVGLALLTMYLLQLGVISSLLSDPVLEGFMTASVFVMTMAQVPHILGLNNVPSGMSTVAKFVYCMSHLTESNVFTLMVTLGSLAVLVIIKFLDSKIPRIPLPGPLVVVVIGILIASFTDIVKEPYNVAVIGDIDAGFPSPVVPAISVTQTNAHRDDIGSIPTIVDLVREGILMAFLFYIVHVSIARAVANITELPVDANQELLALGITNASGSFFRTFPNASSLSRTSLVTAIGARTPFHSLVSVCSIVLIICYATSLFSNLPYACLSAIVIFGVARMITFKNLKRLYGHQIEILKKRINSKDDDGNIVCHDFLLWVTAFLITLFIGTLEGILMSLALSVFLILSSSSRPPVAILGRLPGSSIFRNLQRFPVAQTYHGIVVFRFDASLIFSNAEYFNRQVKTHISSLLREGYSDSDDCKDVRRAISPEQVAWLRDMLTTMVKTLRRGGVDLLDPNERENMMKIESNESDINNDYLKSNWCYPPVIIIDASSMNELDMTAVAMLERLVPHAQNNGVLFLLANWKGPVRDFLDFSHFYKTLPPDRCFLALHDAVLTALSYQATLRAIIHDYVVETPPGLCRSDENMVPLMEVKAATTKARYFNRSLQYDGCVISGLLSSDIKDT